jgi:hypothetical protein
MWIAISTIIFSNAKVLRDFKFDNTRYVALTEGNNSPPPLISIKLKRGKPTLKLNDPPFLFSKKALLLRGNSHEKGVGGSKSRLSMLSSSSPSTQRFFNHLPNE